MTESERKRWKSGGGFRDPMRREEQLRALEKHYREKGYSDGYGGKMARSNEANYQDGWRKGRQARRAFDDSIDAELRGILDDA